MDSLSDLLGRAPAIAQLREQIHQVAGRLSHAGRLPPILLEGETGTGKNLVASVIHRRGPRRDGRFVDVNCAAIPEGLLEAELFGYERGAFTDARHAKAGLFQCAHGGTIFLDEIGLLGDALQAKLLKVIEERTVRRLGSTRSETVDVSIVAATNEDLAEAVRARRFRTDLYHRLAVVTLRLPSLRERPEDIGLLAEHFLACACQDYGLTPKSLTPAALAALRAYRWPGNVRELANTMERVALLAESARITPDALDLPPPSADAAGEPAPAGSLHARVESLERQELLRALEQTRWNVVRAAARLGITRGTMRYRLEKYGLETPARRQRGRRIASAPSVEPSAPPAPAAPASTRWEPRLLVLMAVTPRSPAGDAAVPEFGRDFDTIVRKVESFAGRIEEAGGSRVVAAFGIDLAEDTPRRAALAAMAIRHSLAPRAEPGRGAAVTIAVHAEDCPVRHVSGRGEIDGDIRRRLTEVLGELGAHAEAGAIVVSPAARSLLHRFEFDGGRLLGYGPEPFGPGPLRAPFVGREAELDVLRARWQEARLGRGQLVALVGEPGIGKSRLLFELRRALASEPLLSLEGHAESHGRGVPYLPVIDVLRGFFRIEERDEPTVMADKVRSRLRALDVALAPDASPVLALLGVPGADPEWQAIDPAQRRQRTLDALKRVVLRASQVQPVLLAIEDLHWIDTETQAFLDRLVVGLPAARLLIVVTYRPEYRHALGPASYTQLHLDPLAPESAQQLARGLLGSDATLAPLTRLLIERTEGNPFFLEESVRTLVETGRLVGERGAYRLGPGRHDLDVPPTVRAVLAARIDRLATEDRRVVQAAAVVGKDIPLPLLLPIAGVPEATLRRILTDLHAAELLRETRLVPDVELSFKHALTHEVAYGTLAPDRRRALHARVVEVLEQTSAERPTEQVERLAHHALSAELWPKALVYCRQAGARAAWHSAHREAVQYFEHALTAIRHLPETLATREETLDLYLQLRWSLVPLGDYHRLADSLRSAAAAAAGLNDPLRVGEISQSMTNYLRLIGDCGGALEAGRRALAIAGELANRTLEARATYQLGLVYRQLGDYPRAISALQSVVDALQGEPLYERFGEPSVLSVHARAWLAMALADVGRAGDGIALAEDAVRIATDARNAFSRTTSHLSLGTVLVRAGKLDEGLRVLERSVALCRDGNFLLLLPHTASMLGAALAQAGRLDEALPLLELAVETAAAKGLIGGASLYLVRLGHGVLRAKRGAEACELARRALDTARQLKERGHEARALHLMGALAVHGEAPDLDTARRHYTEACELARTLGMQPLVAQCEAALSALPGPRGAVVDSRR
jgi:transcriptional regulator with AAA-type ATPase domain/tetratricopeptide (TPR) repeat protein